jgi:signal transduction histidine kinase
LEQFGDIADQRQGKVRVVEDLSALTRLSALDRQWQAEGVRSSISVPLRARGELIGSLNLGSDHPHAFVQEHIEITGEVADQLAIAIRQSQLHQELQRANDELRQVDRMKSEFVSNVSHELRTPLTTILGYTELLREAHGVAHNPWEAEGLHTIYGNCQRLLGLVNDLLDVSRLESSKFTISPAPLTPAPLLRQLVEEAQLMAGKKGLKVEADLPDDLPPLMADGPRVAQVLNNLLSNAMKFTPSGGQVQVRGSKVELGSGATAAIAGLPEGKWLLVSVTDTGIGIPPEELPYLFSRFHRGAEAQRRAIRGTGLGLYVAKAIMEAHGGHIGVESRVGKGSTFWFALPMAVESL